MWCPRVTLVTLTSDARTMQCGSFFYFVTHVIFMKITFYGMDKKIVLCRTYQRKIVILIYKNSIKTKEEKEKITKFI